MNSALNRVEELQDFRSFVSAGVEHLLQRSSMEPSAAAQNEQSSGGGAEDTTTSSALPADTVERMKDLLLDVDRLLDRLRTGLRSSSDTFSSAAEDYVPTTDQDRPGVINQ